MKGFFKQTWVHIFLLIVFYLSILFISKPATFSYRFDERLIDRYYQSQDIPREVRQREFLSDSDLYIATGYLYAKGADPTYYNFQAPPFVKYLFGFSTVLLGNPLYVQIAFGVLLIVLVYLIGINAYKKPLVAIAACAFLIVDPVFMEVTSSALLDLGQAALLLLYIYLILWHERKYVLQGAVLGILAACKFWAGPMFFAVLVTGYLLYKKRLDIKRFALHLLIAGITFSLTYMVTFVNHGFLFNIAFFQLKILKFLLVHDIRSVPFASFLLFSTGYLQTWWGTHAWSRAEVWSMLWPIGLIISLANIRDIFVKRVIDNRILIGIIPLLYLLYLGIQAPFTRYFILILPFLYLNLSSKLIKR